MREMSEQQKRKERKKFFHFVERRGVFASDIANEFAI